MHMVLDTIVARINQLFPGFLLLTVPRLLLHSTITVRSTLQRTQCEAIISDYTKEG